MRVHDLAPKERWSRRYEHINAFEEMLHDDGAHVLKLYVHIDADEQLERFEQRIRDPARRWKISEADCAERALWGSYTEAFEDAISRCGTEHGHLGFQVQCPARDDRARHRDEAPGVVT